MKAQDPIRRMQSDDLPRCDELRRIAGWNQRPSDWQRFLDLSPDGCFVAEHQGVVVGTVTTICYGRAVAWIGMLLVHPDMRGRGFGKALLIHAIEHLKNEKVESIKLDATPLGETLYRKLGFQEEWQLTRFKGTTSGSATTRPELFQLGQDALPEIIELDSRVFGVDRSQLIGALLSSSRFAIGCRREGRLEGFGLLRSGSTADYLGPVVALNERVAMDVIVDLLESLEPARDFYWDVPLPNKAASSVAGKLGLVAERSLLRMFLGRNEHPGDITKYFGIADPSVG